ncbi:DUF6292 family protein [Actinomadura syzygii]|uniref:DUF6292 domain-containing protein n=1 Tax=Actinomadura syzygii TaxID=1427538 RepID=A0A5D0TRV0_9ACTN|nr:DUF6292 family protein [Actinomadura syzygii]TYC08567.1 hypothetical protein FXF65_37365 [Actinomadura syzygii]
MIAEREAKIREYLAYAAAGNDTPGDVYARELLAELDAARDALRLAEADGDSARRDLTGAYTVLIGVMPGNRPPSTTAAAEKAAKMIRDHVAERERIVADERRRRATHVRQIEAERDTARPALAAAIDPCTAPPSRAPVVEDEPPEKGPEEYTPLTTYLDAVIDALMAAGLGVRDNLSDEHGPLLLIDLDPVSAVRQPVMDWTPAAGWRIAMKHRGRIRPSTIRYLAAGPVPSPTEVAGRARSWLNSPHALTRALPKYDTSHWMDAALAQAIR